MPLDRPARPPAGAVTDRVRSAILIEAQRRKLDPATLLDLHAEAEYLGDLADVVADVEERYLMPKGSFVGAVWRRIHGDAQPQFERDREQTALRRPREILLELPDAEFLTVIEHAIQLAPGRTSTPAQQIANLYEYVDGALRAHGTPYRATTGGDWCFEWIGDPKQHELTVQPALRALADERLRGGPRDDFERALRKRRVGAAKDREEAIIAAARAVESVLKVLYEEHDIKKPAKHELAGLFNGLAHPDAAVLPGYVQYLVLAVGEPRNHMAGHGPGSDVRAVPEDLADASIAAAATAITYLAHQLP